MLKNTTKRVKLLRNIITNHAEDFPEQYRNSLKLKLWQLKMYTLVLLAYLFLLLGHELVKIIVIAADMNIGQFSDEI